jgi:hypothetical protein
LIESLDRPKDIRDIWDLNSSSASNSSLHRVRSSRGDTSFSTGSEENSLRHRRQDMSSSHRRTTHGLESSGASSSGFSSVSPYASSILGAAFKTAHLSAQPAYRQSDRWAEPHPYRDHKAGYEDKQSAYRAKAQQAIDSVLGAAAQRFALEETLRRCEQGETEGRSEVVVEWEGRSKLLRAGFFVGGLKVVEDGEVQWRAVLRCGEELEAAELTEIAAQIRQAAVEDYWLRRVKAALSAEASDRLDVGVAEELSRFALYCECQSTLLSMHSGAMKKAGAGATRLPVNSLVPSSEGKTLGKALLAPLPSLVEEARSLEPSPFLPSLSFSGSLNLTLSNSASYRPQRRAVSPDEDPLSLSVTLSSSAVERGIN